MTSINHSIKLLKSILFSQGLQQTALTVVGNMAGTALSAVALIIISRILGPTEFGQFSVGFAIVLILIKINDVGLSAIVLKFAGQTTDVTTIKQVFASTMRLKLIISGGLILIGLIASSWLTSLFKLTDPFIVPLAVTVGLSTAYYEQVLSMLQSLQLFSRAVLMNAIQAATKLVGALVFLWLGWKQTSLLFGWYSFAPLVPALAVRWLLPRKYFFSLNLKPPTNLRQPMVSFAKHTSVALLSAGIIENVDVLFVQRYLSSYETGLLGGTGRIALLFALIAYSLGNVLNPRVSRYSDIHHLKKYLPKAIAVAAAALLGYLLIVPFARILIVITIGSAYLPGTSILLIMLAAQFLAIASIPFIALFYSHDAPWYFSVSGLLQLIIVLVGNGVFVPIYGLPAAAWTRLFTRLFLLIFTAGLGFWLYLQKANSTNHI